MKDSNPPHPTTPLSGGTGFSDVTVAGGSGWVESIEVQGLVGEQATVQECKSVGEEVVMGHRLLGLAEW